MTNPKDIIRDAILRYLYTVHQKARSPKTAGQGIRDIMSGMKKFGYKQQEIASNLDYLIQKGWIREIVEKRSFTTKRGTIQDSEKSTYKVSDIGIDKLETASMYQHPLTSSGINITNIRGVTIIGEGNIVNMNFTDLSRTIDEFKMAVQASNSFSDIEKLNTFADLNTLQSQLQKPVPDKSIIQKIWSGIEKVATVGEIAELIQKVGTLLIPLLS